MATKAVRATDDALGREGDVFIAISTSGRAPNIKLALAEARRRASSAWVSPAPKAETCRSCATFASRFPSDETPKIQEGQHRLRTYHLRLVERVMFGWPKN